MKCDPPPPEYINFFETISILAGDHLVVPIGVSHISSWLQKYNQGGGWKEQRTNEQYGLGQLKCKKVKLWHSALLVPL